MFSAPFILLIFGVSFFVTLYKKVGATFAYVLIPTLLLFYNVAAIGVSGLPDVGTLSAISYGVMLALACRGWERPFDFHWFDFLYLSLVVQKVVAGMAVEQIYTGVSTFGQQFLDVVVPYFMARAAFHSPHYRLRAAMVVAGLAVPMAMLALIEMRLYPLFVSRTLKGFGLSEVAWVAVQQRFGLFRAQVTFSHPIDLGNGGALLLCVLTVLATTSGRRLTTPWVAAGVAAGFTMIMASMSFTSYICVSAIGGLYLLIRFVPLGSYLLVPIVLTAIVGYSGLTMHFVETPLDRPSWEDVESGEVGATEGPYFIRHLIVKRTWPAVATAGLFGHGQVTNPQRDFGLESIDNAYMLFALDDGWLYLVLFLAMAVGVCLMTSWAAAKIPYGPARTPMAAGAGGIVGTILGLYTVFFGFVFAQLFLVLIGLTVSMVQAVYERTGDAPRRLEGRDGDPDSPTSPESAGAFAA